MTTPADIMMAVFSASLLVNGFFLRGVAKDLKDTRKRLTVQEKTNAVQDWRLSNLERPTGRI